MEKTHGKSHGKSSFKYHLIHLIHPVDRKYLEKNRLSQTFFVTSLQQKTVFIGYRRQSSLLKAIASKLFLALDASPVRMAGKVNVCIATDG